MRTSTRRALAASSILFLLTACGDGDSADPAADRSDRSVSFLEPTPDGTYAGGVTLRMEATGFTVEPAGEIHDGAGHLHVIADAGCVQPGESIPKDADHVHFGQGQTEGRIFLEPGRHELCLQAGDGTHAALDLTDRVTVTAGILDRAGLCNTFREVDELFAAADDSDDDFPTRQIAYENIRRLLAQLAAAPDQVDADAQADVAQVVADASAIAATFVDAADEDAATEALVAHFGVEGIQSDTAGATWILDACDVDIDD